MEQLLNIAKQKLEAARAYNDAIRQEIYSYEPMDPETFWKVLDYLASDLFKDAASKLTRGVKSCMHNFMCAAVYGTLPFPIEGWETPDKGVMRFDQSPQDEGQIELSCWKKLCRFLARYNQISSDLSEKMWDMPGLERSDDGFGDLMDSLPLAGREVVAGIMEDDIANYKQLEKALFKVCHPQEDFILHGENYIRMMLSEALEKAFLSVARDLTYDEEEVRSREEPPYCVVVGGLDRPVEVYGPYQGKEQAHKFREQEGEMGAAVRRLVQKPIRK